MLYNIRANTGRLQWPVSTVKPLQYDPEHDGASDLQATQDALHHSNLDLTPLANNSSPQQFQCSDSHVEDPGSAPSTSQIRTILCSQWVSDAWFLLEPSIPPETFQWTQSVAGFICTHIPASSNCNVMDLNGSVWRTVLMRSKRSKLLHCSWT